MNLRMGAVKTRANVADLRLLDEAEKGWASAEKDGWVSEEDAYRTLGVT